MYSYLFRGLHSIAPSYLAETLHLSSGVESRRRLRSGSFNIDITRADHMTNYTWRSSISSGHCVGLECSADVCQNYWIVHCVQATDKSDAVQSIFQRSPNMIAPVVIVAVTADMRHCCLYSAPAQGRIKRGTRRQCPSMGHWLQVMSLPRPHRSVIEEFTRFNRRLSFV